MTERPREFLLDPSRIPQELLARYHKSGPRYTSYPTALQFSTEFDLQAISRDWRNSNLQPAKSLSLYLHLPFCRKRCLYCGCYTEITHSDQTIQDYCMALLAELDRRLELIDHHRPVVQLALGGGTPSLLKLEDLDALLNGITQTLHFTDNSERSIEIDPRGVTTDYLDGLLELGFTRFSFGIQDLDHHVQAIIGRTCPATKIEQILNHLQARTFTAVNLDLMYGLPGQTEQSFERTIDHVWKLNPSRIAVFGYAHVPWISPHQKALESQGIPPPAHRMKLFGIAYRKLLDAGYVPIGMDHFAKPDDELTQALRTRTLTRNFMGYTTRRGLDLIGLGASAISSVGLTYTQNLKGVKDYLGRKQAETWFKALLLNGEDALRREIILELFCNFYLDLEALNLRYDLDFTDHFHAELQALAPLADDGLVTISERAIEVTNLGRFFIRNICMTFDQYLNSSLADKRYSKTI